MRTKQLAISIAIVAVLALTMLPSLASAEAPKTITIGVCAALTGFASGAEIHVRDGVLLAVDYINNEKGGVTIKGQKYLLKAVVEDNKTSAEGSKASAEKLVNGHKAKIILGATMPFMNIPLGGVTEPAKVLRFVNYVCDVGEISARTPYTFLANPAITQGMGPALDYLVEKFPKAKTIATLTPQDGAETILGGISEKEAAKRGLKQLSVVVWPQDTTDWYPKITQALSVKPDAIFFANGYEQATGPMMKAAREQGFQGPGVMPCYDDPYDIAALSGKLAAPFWTHGWGRDPSDPLLTADMKEVIKRATAKQGKFHQWNFWGWNEVMLVVQVIEKAQTLDTTALADTMRKMTNFKTVWGPAKMGGEKRYGIKNIVVSRVAITEVLPDGSVKMVKWVDADVP